MSSPNAIWAEKGQASFLRHRLHKWFHRHINDLRVDGLPCCLYDRDSCLAILIHAGFSDRTIIVLASKESPAIDERLTHFFALAERKCRQLRRGRLTCRCPVWPTSPETSSDLLSRLMPEHWSEPELMQTYRRRNLRGLDEPLKWLAREYPSDNMASGLEIVPWQHLATRPDITEKVRVVAPLCPELWPDMNDFDPLYSVAFVRDIPSADYQLAGWMIVSRRERGLLYNRLYVDSEYPRFWNLGTRLVAAALLTQSRCEPDLAVFLHVRKSQTKIATRYQKYLGPWCDRIEENWVSHIADEVPR